MRSHRQSLCEAPAQYSMTTALPVFAATLAPTNISSPSPAMWPHSGFHVHDSVFVPEGDTDFAARLARYCARNPVALERMEYGANAVIDRLSDRRIRWSSDCDLRSRSQFLDPLIT
jgi:hypothetical protein